MKLSTSSFRGYNLFAHNLEDIPSSCQTVVNTLNQYSFCIAEEDLDFKHALQESDVLLPDGIGIVVAVNAVNEQSIKKISGADLHRHTLERLNRKGGKCFYLGSTEATLKKIQAKLQSEYANVKCDFFSPPFAEVFSDEENTEIIARINAFNPDAIFVGMTAPKQEKWVGHHQNRLNAKLICTIGAAFDFYAGTVARPSAIWVKMGLEWLVRLCREPKRMWKRYIYYGPIFIYILLKEKLETDLKGTFAFYHN